MLIIFFCLLYRSKDFEILGAITRHFTSNVYTYTLAFSTHARVELAPDNTIIEVSNRKLFQLTILTNKL